MIDIKSYELIPTHLQIISIENFWTGIQSKTKTKIIFKNSNDNQIYIYDAQLNDITLVSLTFVKAIALVSIAN